MIFWKELLKVIENKPTGVVSIPLVKGLRILIVGNFLILLKMRLKLKMLIFIGEQNTKVIN